MIGGLLALFAYGLGSLPTGLWIAKAIKGKDFDIRDWGSGNIGATNVLRVLGWRVSLPVFAADFLKGFLPAWLALRWAGEPWAIGCLIAAILGHARSFILFLWEGKFSGGKSVATAFGGLVALQPVIALSAFGFFLIVLFATRYLSLASMGSALFSVVLAVVLHRGLFWTWALAAIALFILYTHLRNIVNLISRTEHKFGKSFAVHGQEAGVRTAFVIHSVTENDLGQLPVSAWMLGLKRKGWLPPRRLRWLVAHAPVIKIDGITGIVGATGKPATVIIFGIPMLPDQIMDPVNRELVESLLKRAAVLAQRMGATILGLGALLSSAVRGGADLQKWAKERGLTITIDNGGAFTAAATIQALRQVKPDLASATVAIVGASGVIGMAIARYFSSSSGRVGRLLLFARTRSRIECFEGLAQLLSSQELDQIFQAEVVIFATSSPTPLITAENAHLFQPGAVVLDIAVPADVDDQILAARPDISLVRCGLIQLPGQARSRIDFHFGEVRVGREVHQLFPACLAQGLLLAYTGDYRKASQGVRIEPEVIDWFSAAAEQHGFKVITSRIDERAVFSGRKTSDGS